MIGRDEEQIAVELDRDFNNKKSLKKKKINKFLKIGGFLLVGVLIIAALVIGTKGGRKVIYKMASGFIYSSVDRDDVIREFKKHEIIKGDDDKTPATVDHEKNIIIPEVPLVPRYEAYVTNYLIFGIEEIKGAKNTDSMLIASINTRDDTIKLTSLLRDSYVEIPSFKPNKLNAAYALGGKETLIDTIEQNFLIHIDGYASVNFNEFEKIVDYLGGISIKLGEEEAHYLNTTNYISNRANRNVMAGYNLLNGNQVVGYCRVRKCVTLGGYNDDYGRSIRQQRVLDAIFDKYKSKSMLECLRIMKDCLGFLKTDLTEKQIEKALEDIVENRITTLDKFRIPINESFDDPKEFNGIKDPLVLDWNVNRIELYKYIFLDTKEEAEAVLTRK